MTADTGRGPDPEDRDPEEAPERLGWRDFLPLGTWALWISVLPLVPTQDGPAHLLTAATLVDWLTGDPMARGLFELRTDLATNWTGILVLAGFQALGLSAAWAEKLWWILVGAVWIDAFARLRRELGISRLVPWLVLLLFQGWVARIGLSSFLFATGLGLGVWARRRSGRFRPLDHLLLVLSAVSHPFGLALALALSALDDLLARRPHRLLGFLPHGLVLVLVVLHGVGGGWGVPPPELPDLLGRSLGHWVSVVHAATVPRLVLLAVLAAWAAVTFPLRRRSRRRLVLALLAGAALAASAVGPDVIGTGSMVRPRMAFLAWALGFLALPLTPRPGRGRIWAMTGAIALGSTLGPSLLHTWGVARDQASLIAALPSLAPGDLAAASLDSEGGGPAAGVRSRSWLYLPDIQVADRWLVAERARNPFTYPTQTEHFPVGSRIRVSEPFLDYLHWRPSRVPLEALADVLDAYCVIDPPVGAADALRGRLSGTWAPSSAGPRHLCFRSREPLPRGERFELEAWPREPRPLPEPVPIAPRFEGDDFVLCATPAHAFWSWRAFVREADGRVRPAGPDRIDPAAGTFDPRGCVRITSSSPPEPPRLLVLLSG